MSDQSIEAALILHLKGWPDIAAIVEGRIYPDFVPQPASVGGTATDENLPAIAVVIDGDDPAETLDQPATLYMSELEVHCWATSKSQSEDLRRAVRDSLNGFIGTLGDYENVKIEGLTTQRSVVVGVGQSQRRAYGAVVAGSIWYTLPAPFQLNTLS